MARLVTVGIPVYKRLDYLPQALTSVGLQGYPNIELIVSDNGLNGPQITEIVDKYYSKPYKVRHNSSSVAVITHFNEIINEASGEYFVLLSDDDEISPNYIAELVSILESNPQVSIAFSKTEAIDESNRLLRSLDDRVPDIMSAEDFIQAWCSYKYNFIGFLTNLARTNDIRSCGGYPEFVSGIHSDNALVVKMCLNKHVAFSQKCTFRYRVYESSTGLSVNYQDLANASKQFLKFLDSDRTIGQFGRAHPNRWAEMRYGLRKMVWETYFHRWRYMYRRRLERREWIKAGFVLPFIREYYTGVGLVLGRSILNYTKKQVMRG